MVSLMSFLELLVSNPWLATALAALSGLLVGSFLNVVIVRLPQMMEREWREQCLALRHESEPDAAGSPGAGPAIPAAPSYNLALPRSHCPSCGHTLAWYENLPVLSWLCLRGKCSRCKRPISWRYPVVELSTAVLFALCVLTLGPGTAALAGMGLCAALLALAFIDADTTLLPDDITLPLLWAGLLVNLFGVFTSLSAAVIGAMAGYLSLWLVYWGFRLVTGKEGMGFGDFKLLAAIGAWFGWQALPLVILLSSVVGVIIGGGLMLTGRAQRGQALPFGPYLAGAGVLALLWGERWQSWLWPGI